MSDLEANNSPSPTKELESKEVIDQKVEPEHHGLADRVHRLSVTSIDPSTKEGQMYSMNDVDPVLDMKMRLVNEVRDLLLRQCFAIENWLIC